MKRINANELRVGNWVNNSLAGNVKLTNELMWPLIKFGSQGTADLKQYFDRHSFIPITEEWLLKFGFTYSDSPHYREWNFINDKFYSYKVVINDTTEEFRWFSKVIPNVDKVVYVHQLQNLYFALTQEELSIST